MSSSFRVDGLVSGLNTTDIINQLISVERQPLRQMQQQQTDIKNRQSAWSDIISGVSRLQTSLSSLLQRATISGNVVNFTGTTTALTATASPSASPGSYSISISQIASPTTRRSTTPIGAEIDTTAKLDTVNFFSPASSGSFSINGVAIQVDVANDSLDDVVARINASSAGVTATVASVDGHLRLALSANAPGGPMQIGSAGDTSNFLNLAKLTAAPRAGDTITGAGSLAATRLGDSLDTGALASQVSGSGTLTINGREIAYDTSTDSLNSLMSKINNSTAGVNASYDPINDRLLLQNRQTGSLAMTISDSGELASALGLDTDASQTLGVNAAYSLDGGLSTRYSNSNSVTDAIPGVTLNLIETTTSSVRFAVAPNVEGAVSAIQRFVGDFNSVLSTIRSATSYDAATKRAGLLLGDSVALGLETSLRSMIVNPSPDQNAYYRTLSQIGISFGTYGSAVGTTNNLQVDETKLRAALQANPAVFQLLSGQNSAVLSARGDIAMVAGAPKGLKGDGHFQITSDSSGTLIATLYDANGNAGTPVSGTTAPGGINSSLIPGMALTAAETLTGASSTVNVFHRQGVLTTLNQYLSDALGPQGFLKVQTSTDDDQISKLDKAMQELQVRLDDKQQKLVQQFATMEATLSKLQAQSQALERQLAGLMTNG